NNNQPSYIQVFRCEKPAHLVARRNARERKRVQAVNSAFSRLQKAVPTENQSKRLSKVKTLQKAIEYISDLMDLLDKANEIETNSTIDSPSSSDTRSSTCSTQETTTFIAFPNKENSTCHDSQQVSFNNKFVLPLLVMTQLMCIFIDYE
ncbi:achaete-scute 1a-like protein, partial [Leptotrombidium deliense]